jgi:hypothetical protein
MVLASKKFPINNLWVQYWVKSFYQIIQRLPKGCPEFITPSVYPMLWVLFPASLFLNYSVNLMTLISFFMCNQEHFPGSLI